MAETSTKQSVLMTWIFIIFLAVYFVVYSLSTLILVGDQGPPDWDFNIVEDVPGGSPTAIYQKLPYPQHVKGEKRDFTNSNIQDGGAKR